MKRTTKFLTFLESLKTSESSALIESIKSGYMAINENYVDLEDDDVFNRHYGDDIQHGELYNKDIDGGEETEFDRELEDIASNAPHTRGRAAAAKPTTTDVDTSGRQQAAFDKRNAPIIAQMDKVEKLLNTARKNYTLRSSKEESERFWNLKNQYDNLQSQLKHSSDIAPDYSTGNANAYDPEEYDQFGIVDEHYSH